MPSPIYFAQYIGKTLVQIKATLPDLGGRVEPEVAFGRALRKLRKQRGVSQEALALEADIERNYISLLELGRFSASLKIIFKLARALNIRPSHLIELAEIEIAEPAE